MKQLKNRVAVVTGVASGIGRELSILLAKEGADLAIADINEEGLKATYNEVEKIGGKVSMHLLDVSDRAAMEQFPRDVIEIHQHVHLLVNNAGVAVTDTVLNGDLKDFEWLMGINFWGVVYGCKFFLPYLLKEDEAHIVNLSSIFGLAGVSSQAVYCSAKFAVRGFTETLIAELKGSNVRVSCVHPGGVTTNIAKNARFKKSFNCEQREEMVNLFAKLTQFMSPQKAAKILLKGIKGNKRRILIGPDSRLISVVTRLSPSYYHGVPRFFFRMLYPDKNTYKTV